jgi:hypothetical protein
MTDAVQKIREVRDVQGRDGNWNSSPYMRGLYNGLEMALALLEGEREPVYREDPSDGYLSDRHSGEAQAIQRAVNEATANPGRTIQAEGGGE